MFNTNVYNEGSSFKFNVDAVSGTLHKSTRKSKFCVRSVNDESYIFDTEHPRLNAYSEEIVILQTMLCGENNILVEYMTRTDYDEMFDGPLPQINVGNMLNDIRNEIDKSIKREEDLEKMMKYDEKEGYYDFKFDRRKLFKSLTKEITEKVCKYLEDKHIGTFDFS